MPDAWELAHGPNTNSASDAAGELDGDGTTNLEEYLAGTNPTDPLSRFWLQPVSFEAGALHLRFAAAADHSYTVEWAPLLPLLPLLPPWTAIYDVPAEPLAHDVDLSVPSNGQPRGFYRVRTP